MLSKLWKKIKALEWIDYIGLVGYVSFCIAIPYLFWLILSGVVP